MNVYDLVFDKIKPTELNKDVETIFGRKISAGIPVYKILVLEYKVGQVNLNGSYIMKDEFHLARNMWHCYDVDIDNNHVTLRRNQEIPLTGHNWKPPMVRDTEWCKQHMEISNMGMYGKFGQNPCGEVIIPMDKSNIECPASIKAFDMMSMSMDELPNLARKYLEYVSSRIGKRLLTGIEINMVAYAHYAQAVLGLDCVNPKYKIDGDGIAWFHKGS